MTTPKTPARLVKLDGLKFVPRAEGGDQAQVAPICSSGDGSELSAGMARLNNARLEWTVKYDEVLHVISGHIKVHTPEGILEAGPRDSIWLPAGTPLTYEAEDALILFAIHPANWADIQAE
jgi:ethanolamine utilization protein EutQ